MINLLPWRDQYSKKKKIEAFIIIAVVYGLFFCAAIVYFIKCKQQLINRAQHMPAVTIIKKTSLHREAVIQKIIDLLLKLPNNLTVIRVSCGQTSCDVQLAARQSDAFFRVNWLHITDIQQGVCPLCYQAKASVIL